MIQTEDLKQLTHCVCETARKAGAYIRQERARFSVDNVERKHAHDYVSYVDKGSERMIVEDLKALLPEAGFITEEGLATHHDEQMLWVVDPLDGTTNFIHNYAPYAVSIALTKGKDILLGVVYDVCSDECFYAWKDGGAYADEQPIHVAANKTDDALICLQLPYNSDAYKPVILRLIDRYYGNVGSIRMIGSAAMALCYVASGHLDAYAEKYLGPWDYMAGALIVKEAGGRVTSFEGDADFMKSGGVLASTPSLSLSLTAD